MTPKIGQRVQVDWDTGVLKGVGREFVYVRLDAPKARRDYHIRYVFAQSRTVSGSLTSVTYLTNAKGKA